MLRTDVTMRSGVVLVVLLAASACAPKHKVVQVDPRPPSNSPTSSAPPLSSETPHAPATATPQPSKIYPKTANCRSGPADRPVFVWIYFRDLSKKPHWTFADAKKAMVTVGIPTNVLDRVAKQGYIGQTEAVGTEGSLVPAAARLLSYPPPAGQGKPVVRVYCEGYEYVSDVLIVEAREGVRIEDLIRRHGSRERQGTSTSESGGKTTTETLPPMKTDRGTNWWSLVTTDERFVIRRAIDYLSDPNVMSVEVGLTCGGNGTEFSGRPIPCDTSPVASPSTSAGPR